MNFWKSIGFIVMVLAGVGCIDGEQRDFNEGEDKALGDAPSWNTSMINIPGTASDHPDPASVRPTLAFEDTVYHFGTVSDGFVVSHTFSFVNQGPGPAGISNVSATCGCTVPKTWPREPLAEGKRGSIEVTFDTGGKSSFEEVDKIITVNANTNPSVIRLHMVGTVLPPALPSGNPQ